MDLARQRVSDRNTVSRGSRSVARQLTADIRKGIASTGHNSNLAALDVDLVCEILAAMLEETCATFLLYSAAIARDTITEHITVMWGRILGYEVMTAK